MAKDKRVYRVVQNEGKISWRVEELWEGGVVRGPYNSKETATAFEQRTAKENGFIDELTFEVVGGEVTVPSNAFEKDKEGTWHCVRACSLNIDNKEIDFSAGMKFTKGASYLGVDVIGWLDKNYKK